jgi:hypothetical protein
VAQAEVQQAVLAADMPVQGGGAGAEFLGQAAHAQCRQALAVEEPDRGGHDRVPADRLLATPGRAVTPQQPVTPQQAVIPRQPVTHGAGSPRSS